LTALHSGLKSTPVDLSRLCSQLWQFPLEDELVVARPDVQALFLLNATARFFWEEFGRGAALGEIVQRFAASYAVPQTLARQDLEATLGTWTRSVLAHLPARGSLPEHTASVRREFAGNGSVEINCILNSRPFRVLLEPGDLVAEIAPRLAPVAVSCLPPDSPVCTFALANSEDQVLIFRDGVCVARENTVSGARAILLQELAARCNSGREAKAILHAGACGTASGCVILAGASHAGKSTLCAALMAAGLYCYSDDSVVLDEHFHAAGMPFPLTLRESSWPLLASRFASFRDCPRVHYRWGQKVRFLQSNLPTGSSPTAPPKALVFVRYQPATSTRLQSLTGFEALMELQQSGFWVEHERESIALFLAWIGRLPAYRLTYQSIDEASDTVRGLLV
jgi:hypothetical protein